jgi:hypothetical protein
LLCHHTTPDHTHSRERDEEEKQRGEGERRGARLPTASRYRESREKWNSKGTMVRDLGTLQK